MINENINVVGALKVTVKDETTGQIKQQFEVPNLVVTSGKNYIASRTTGTAQAVMSHMGIGSGMVAPAAADTALGTQLARVALTSSTTTNNVTTYVASFPAGTGTGAVTEAGIFNAASAGTMLCRTTFSVINKGANDSITITWTVTIV